MTGTWFSARVTIRCEERKITFVGAGGVTWSSPGRNIKFSPRAHARHRAFLLGETKRAVAAHEVTESLWEPAATHQSRPPIRLWEMESTVIQQKELSKDYPPYKGGDSLVSQQWLDKPLIPQP